MRTQPIKFILKKNNRYLKHAYEIIEGEKTCAWLYFDTCYALYWVSLYHKPLSKVFKVDIDKTKPVDWLHEQAKVELDKDL